MEKNMNRFKHEYINNDFIIQLYDIAFKSHIKHMIIYHQ